jgi:hypothetical protein
LEIEKEKNTALMDLFLELSPVTTLPPPRSLQRHNVNLPHKEKTGYLKERKGRELAVLSLLVGAEEGGVGIKFFSLLPYLL